MFAIALLLSLLLNSYCVVHGCGITTHTEIGHRALSFFQHKTEHKADFKQVIENHQDAFQAGNAYPDSFYSSVCYHGVFHQVSEDTHWSPFLSTTLDYIRTTYPQPWNEETRKLIAFMLGFVSHQVADVSWHSLGIDQGFLSTMGMTDFHGSFDKAHSAGDVGGDIVNEFELNLDYINSTAPWYIPVDDLFNIYQLYYSGHTNMTRQVIEDCTLIMFLARLGEKLAIKKLFPDYAYKSPFLVHQLSDYFLGGMNDMAVWTTNIWDEAIHILNEGDSSCSVPRSPLFIRCNKTRQVVNDVENGQSLKNGYFVEPRLYGLSRRDVDIMRTQRGVYFSPKRHLLETLELLKWKSLQQTASNIQQGREERKYRKPNAVYRTNEPYADLGRSLLTADFNGDGHFDVAFGAPGHSAGLGRVYFIHGSEQGLPLVDDVIELIANDSRLGLHQNGKFGWSLAAVDFNCDGVTDLAVSAPSVGSPELTYRGEVYIYYGHGQHGLSPKPDVTIQCSNPTLTPTPVEMWKINRFANLKIRRYLERKRPAVGNYISCGHRRLLSTYCNLGWSLAGGDLNRDGCADLVIGSPYAAAGGSQRGLVGVIYAKKSFAGHMLSTSDFDWSVSGDQDYGWYGYSVGVKRTSFSGTWLMIGSPTYRKCARANCSFSPDDVQRTGKFFVYDQLLPSRKPRHIFVGKTEFENLGSSFSIGTPYEKYTDMLAIAQTGLSTIGLVEGYKTYLPQVGGVSVYNVSVLLRNVQYRSVMFYGDRLFDRFGSKVLFTDLLDEGLDDLIVTSPFRTVDPTEEISGAEQGIAYVYLHSNITQDRFFPIYNATFDRCDKEFIQPCPAHVADLVLEFGEDGARFGTAVTVVPSERFSFLTVTASHSSRPGARLGGAVAVFQLSKHED